MPPPTTRKAAASLMITLSVLLFLLVISLVGVGVFVHYGWKHAEPGFGFLCVVSLIISVVVAVNLVIASREADKAAATVPR